MVQTLDLKLRNWEAEELELEEPRIENAEPLLSSSVPQLLS
jgi:hypothetical protein